MAKLYSEGGGGSSLMDGVYLKEVEIVGLVSRDEFNKSKGWDAPMYPKTIDFVVTYKSGDFEKELFLNGNVFKNGSLPQHISSFLISIGIMNDENKDGMIESLANGITPESLVKLAVGKRIKVVEFVKASGYYDTWNGIQEGFKGTVNAFALDTPPDDILNAFKKRLAGKYPPKYDVSGLTAKDELNNQGDDEKIESPI